MPKLLRDLWILTEDGTVIFRECFERVMDTQCFGAVLTSINLLAKKLTNDALSKFEFGDRRLNLIKKENIVFVGSSLNNVKEKKAIKEIEDIAERFLNQYSEEIINFRGDVSTFIDFEP
ncbi:MAG: hypothetical protein ACTSQJ_15440 [Promethearchaeota archaeon]